MRSVDKSTISARPSRPLPRREFFGVAAAAAAAVYCAPKSQAAPVLVDASRYPDLQAAVNATPDGGTVYNTRYNATYGTVTLSRRTNVTLEALTINGPVVLDKCTGVKINRCTIVGDSAGTAVNMWFSTDCTIADCTVTNGGLSGVSPVNCTFSGNKITGAPRNGISVGVLSGVAATGNKYVNNVIRNSARAGIEEYPNGDVNLCRGAVIKGNDIANCYAMGISAPGLDPTISGNTIKECAWGIEITGAKANVSSNTISSTTMTGLGIVVFGRPDAVTQAATVSSNQITGLRTGIVLQASVPEAVLRNASITGNTVTNCAAIGIDAAMTTGQDVKVSNNTIKFTTPTLAGVNRFGLRTGAGMTFDGNKISYTAGSAGPSADMPIHLIGNDVTLANSSVDGGGRTSASNLKEISAIKPAGTYTGWRYKTNKYLNGVTINKTGTVAIEDTDVKSGTTTTTTTTAKPTTTTTAPPPTTTTTTAPPTVASVAPTTTTTVPWYYQGLPVAPTTTTTTTVPWYYNWR